MGGPGSGGHRFYGINPYSTGHCYCRSCGVFYEEYTETQHCIHCGRKVRLKPRHGKRNKIQAALVKRID